MNPNKSRDLTHLRDWKYIIQNWDTLMKESRSLIIRSLRLGVPTKYRGDVWALLTNQKVVKSKANFTYEQIDKVNSNSSHIISLDVPRTMPSWTNDTSQKFRDELSRILNAYANVDPELGYTQGMNFIASMFLIYQPEEQAFWSFYSLMFQSSLPHRLFFIQDFPKLNLLKALVTRLIHENFPDIYEALEERRLDCTLFTPMWLMVCFLSGNFGLELSTFIFEQFLAFGVPPLLSFGLGILEIHKNVLKEKGFEDLLHVLTNPGSSPLMNDKQAVNAAWDKMWITTRRYHQLLKEIIEEEKKKDDSKLLKYIDKDQNTNVPVNE
ncbi:TBC domain containing protein [Trichomonas vaginalis G3]|uniref:TBC domain containing protein n=1 Tax=Trichomonas vaginalis (strain ATCC PRA-98 / G3) TaxID=412133 RepID=A2EQP1_TRIV3|nr:regulation of vesicle fusion [Trichomonas vaginalis G3]EAY05006.1 TBC domain containing protein [Trichomonas vaginalis G3]KAI5502970.1 regulation of vesicle fusion [Trichomonas vaginalis G3]|eukprot:XP_001317229.1 TBC domain containing protein [Trichomonas vaginalis G3]